MMSIGYPSKTTRPIMVTNFFNYFNYFGLPYMVSRSSSFNFSYGHNIAYSVLHNYDAILLQIYDTVANKLCHI